MLLELDAAMTQRRCGLCGHISTGVCAVALELFHEGVEELHAGADEFQLEPEPLFQAGGLW